MQHTSPNSPEEPGISKTLRDDLRRGDIKRSIRRDFRDLEDYFINQERRKRLAAMGTVKRWLYRTFWLLKALFYRLTPARRLLLIASLVLTFSRCSGTTESGVRFENNASLFGALLLLFVLALELKDKLLAREELQAGRAVQEALMPEQAPIVAGWSIWLYTQPANDVGGDLVDFQPLGTDRFGLAISDVMGKGLGAALFTAKLQAILKALAPDYGSLGELGGKLSEIFLRERVGHTFASLLYLVLTAGQGKLRLLNAGHPPPLHLHRGTVRELQKGAPALGLARDNVYAEQEIAPTLRGGDFLLAYSDGLPDCRNEAGEFFGETRVRRILEQAEKMSAPDLGRRLLHEVHAFQGECALHDDLSLIILKFKGESRDEEAAGP